MGSPTTTPLWAKDWRVSDLLKRLDLGDRSEFVTDGILCASLNGITFGEDGTATSFVTEGTTLSELWPMLDLDTQDAIETAFVIYDIRRL